jgi:hypothetical protein
MRLFFDLRLGYLVEAPGQSTPASGYIGKAGDGQPVELQFGRSPDPLGSSILFEAPTWTSTGLPGGTVIQLAIKASGEFSDGPVLASTSTFSYDAGTKTYSGALNLNTEQINTELERGNDDDADDIASVSCGLEVTYQSGGSGAWASSVLPVEYQINHDLIYGDEATPANADDPDEYLLKAAGIEYFPTVTSKIGGTSADLDAVPTVLIDVGKMVAFSDLDGAGPVFRVYKLTAGTEAESSPDIIRPDDYDASTNAKYWLAQEFTAGLTAVADDATPILGGDLDAGGFNIGFDADTGITDDDGNETLYFGKTASAVNYLSIKNAATGSGAEIESKGSDTNIDLILTPKGSGKVKSGSSELIINPMTTAGDLITGGASGAPERLGVGSNGQVLTVTAGALAWGAGSGIANVVDDTTPQLGGILEANAKQVRFSKGADVASANTLVLGTDGNYFDITGATDIDLIASLGDGTVVKLHFDGALNLIHHPTNLILPGGNNITTAAGDEAEFVQYNTANWRCTSYQRASGLPVAMAGGAYREIWIGAGAMTPRTTNGAATATVELATNDVMLDVLDFDTTTEEGASFLFAFPAEWDLGTVKAKVHWTAASGSGGVAWGLRARANADDDAMDSAYGTEQVVTDTLITANDLHVTAASSALTVGNTPAAGDLTIWEITREVANGSDTIAVDARLIGVQIQYLESSTAPASW